ncbi:hypothetical protein DPMN_038504 [Dreissena polymorpha]|uniref:Uncharacterized protein n=1 Tax=Dreissena polymorpha TaxID=45954 RepID=A0A9D4MFE1_DREPO|nr:hypothetical protein DPMN_038504 [Dreissena polymorpha]
MTCSVRTGIILLKYAGVSLAYERYDNRSDDLVAISNGCECPGDENKICSWLVTDATPHHNTATSVYVVLLIGVINLFATTRQTLTLPLAKSTVNLDSSVNKTSFKLARVHR